jgi:hypothetical protein
MSGAHMMLAFVSVTVATFVWQIRKERDKWLFFLMGIGVGCAMVALITH